MVFIVFFITYLLFECFSKYGEKNNPNTADTFTHSDILEVVWTLIPGVILLIVAVPSFALLYSMDEMIDPALTMKIIGHQWYWSYEYNLIVTQQIRLWGILFNYEDEIKNNFDSFLVYAYPNVNKSINSNTCGPLRQLEVDKKLILPTDTQIRLLVTSFDVLHSWTIPSFRIKVDACPGRLNQAQVTLSRLGTFYGQCSEICGINHGFMPIFCRTVSYAYFIKTGYIFYTEFLRLSQILDCNDELLNLLKKKYIYMMIKEDIL
jgi:cytochrome c oxidase subunit 2